jgi:hypothetical protein
MQTLEMHELLLIVAGLRKCSAVLPLLLSWGEDNFWSYPVDLCRQELSMNLLNNLEPCCSRLQKLFFFVEIILRIVLTND